MLLIISENRLDEWVRAHAREAQGLVVELVYRLVIASCGRVRERRFPLADSIGQHGPDGVLEVATEFEPFVPAGRSYWEIGTGLRPRDKATTDYNDLTATIPESIRKESTFIFVTPLSAARDWEYSWKESQQADWLEKRRRRNDWKDVRVIDGTKLTDWIHQFPAIELWLVQKIAGLATHQIETLEQHWQRLKTIGDPSLTPQVFLTNRNEACTEFKAILEGSISQLVLTTRFPDQFVDFVAAYVASLAEDDRIRALGRCLIVRGIEEWHVLCRYQEQFVLVAHPELDIGSENRNALLKDALQNGHAVVWSRLPGGVPMKASHHCALPSKIQTYELRKILAQIGYNEERARVLAERSAGNWSSLLRLLAGGTVQPKWSEHEDATDLAVALLLGAWSDLSVADQKAITLLVGRSYEQWIEKMRSFLLHPSSPLSYYEQQWRFMLRYEGWYTLGQRLFDEHLDRFQRIAIAVLQESEHYSKLLCKGIAETLALLGSHSQALRSCSYKKPETTAILIVRAVLEDADIGRWERLDHLLPLFAEAAPDEFLRVVEQVSQREPCLFDALFAQEGYRSYIASTLWALEVLAWDESLLSRVVLCLGDLAARDPGGQWSSRPINSLTRIFLPWLPQTCASMSKQVSVVRALLTEYPEVGLDLLIRLLPKDFSNQVAWYTSRPTWRDTISDNWNFRVSDQEYWEQILIYANLAVDIAKDNVSRLIKLTDCLKTLPLPVFEKFIKCLNSEEIQALSDEERLPLWEKLLDIITTNSRFAGSEWAIPAEQLEWIVLVTEEIAPKSPLWRSKRLFVKNDFSLYEQRSDNEGQSQLLRIKRQQAVEAILADGEMTAMIAFAEMVESPYEVGFVCGSVAQLAVDGELLPSLLIVDHNKLARFVEGFVCGRFEQKGWNWVDSIDISAWTTEQIGRFLAHLPCQIETWNRLERLLGEEQAAYWRNLSINTSYHAQGELTYPVSQLLRYGRPYAAVFLLAKMLDQGQAPRPDLAINALLQAHKEPEPTHATDNYVIEQVISWLQEHSEVNQEALCTVEWIYLHLLLFHRESSQGPKTLWRKLAGDPLFFCEVIRLSRHAAHSESTGNTSQSVAKQAFDLLQKWPVPPGLRRDGTFDRDELARWLKVVKDECERTGHLEFALNTLGQALAYAPPDPDGLWIHRIAASVLDSKDADTIRHGFVLALYNSRGVHWLDPTGKQNRELSAKYRVQADAVEVAGYYRLADSLRRLAELYDREVKQVILKYTNEE